MAGGIKEVTKLQSLDIVENRKPLGKFLIFDDGVWIGIDNEDGHAWVEEFKTKEECEKWLGKIPHLFNKSYLKKLYGEYCNEADSIKTKRLTYEQFVIEMSRINYYFVEEPTFKQSIEYLIHKTKEDKPMVSDCGNEITSVKFKVWLYDASHGIIELARDPNYKIKGLQESYKFANLEEMSRIMVSLRSKVREQDELNKLSKRKEELKKAKYTMYCPHCDLGFDKRSVALWEKIRGLDYWLVASCTSCNRPVEHL
jgi:hypothetical protein